MTTLHVQDAGVTFPAGYRAAGLHVGIKARRPDLCLVVSDRPAAVAGVFTTNRVQAAPVHYCREIVRAGQTVRAIAVNSGCANACTGERGMADCRRMAALAGEALGVAARDVLVCSTGVIGSPLPMDAIAAGMGRVAAALSVEGTGAAEAIMTTDTVPKRAAVESGAGGARFRVAGMAKGSGMIAPNMATMLGFLTTDALVEPAELQALLADIAGRTFNSITVDGDRSTNDTVLLLANGASGVRVRRGTPAWSAFAEALECVARDLAMRIVRDGEGATKFVTVRVVGAKTAGDAGRAARAVANSLLVKTSWFGKDPNWGRVLAAVGYSGADVDPDRVEIAYDGLVSVRNGQPNPEVSREGLREVLQKKEFEVLIRLHLGEAEATVYTCDCSLDYVRINADYTT